MKIIIIIVTLATLSTAYPLEDGYELVQLVRVPRGVQPYQRYQPARQNYGPMIRRPGHREEYAEEEPLIVSSSHKEPLIMAETGHGHSPYEYVDYGAYTGGYGAFGWYSDHPVGGH